MLMSIECAGHPRDMGLAQGAAARTAIRAEVARLGLPEQRSRIPNLAALTVGALRGFGAGREWFRQFAHQAERLEGLACSAQLPVDSILELHLRIRAGGEQGGLLARRSEVRARTVGGPKDEKRLLLERSLPRAFADEVGWILRESRPEVGFRSIEIGLPWLVSSVAGLNEAGLAVVAGPLLWGAPGREGCPTSLLLVQECLQRFEDLDGAIDWCCKRPVEGEQSLVLADASGNVATVVSSGRERRAQWGEGELHLESGELSESEGALASQTSDAADRVWLDPRGKRLRVELVGSRIEVELGDESAVSIPTLR
ncbi:MAG: hypothetical protein GY910_06440 [bacterium]|nr:hypothetical protein [Deltaproteobacteria bacterium]MCP4904601.1 hypothetical protein [bacterium]